MSRTRARSARSGFTLIELLVVIGIVMVLFGLTVPAVQSAREAARRAECRSRLSDVGKAIQGHVAALGSYPVLIRIDPRDPPPPTGGFPVRWFGPLPQLLPYLDQQSLHGSINFDVPAWGTLYVQTGPEPENRTAARTVLAIFLCPSDPAGSDGPWGPTNLRVCEGYSHFDNDGRPAHDDRGAFIWNYVRGLQPRVLTSADFRDGLSSTAFVSEKIRGTGGQRFDPLSDFWHPLVPAASLREIVDTCASLRGAPGPDDFIDRTGESWMLPSPRFSSYNNNLPPNSPIPDCSVGWNDFQFGDVGCFTARSYHAGGVNVLYGDGRVGWASNGTDAAVWRALGTRDGGEVISEGGGQP